MAASSSGNSAATALTGPAPSNTSDTALRPAMGTSHSPHPARARAARPAPAHPPGSGAGPRHFAHVLAEVADGHPALDRDLPLVGLFLFSDHAQERCLPRAVWTGQADPL